MSEKNDKKEEVYFLGKNSKVAGRKNKRLKTGGFILAFGAVIVLLIFIIICKPSDTYYYEPETVESVQTDFQKTADTNSETSAFIEERSDTVNDVPLFLYIPHYATISLVLGMPDKLDSKVIFAAMAADIRADNMEIVGDFVISGKQIARGEAKKGYCSIINDEITIGFGRNRTLLEKTKENRGFFFRQYPLVENGKLIDNNPKNKSIRRALAICEGELIVIQSQNSESFHDFSQALVDLGVSNAIYLVGGNAYGWFYDQKNIQNEFGTEQKVIPENTSYIIWSSK